MVRIPTLSKSRMVATRLALASSAALGALATTPAMAAQRECAQSPGKTIEVCVSVDEGRATYSVAKHGKVLIEPSTLGLGFKREQKPQFTEIGGVRRNAADTTWEQPWGEERRIRDHHTQFIVTLSSKTELDETFDVVFRIFDDGVGFRYAYNRIAPGRAVEVTSDSSEFRTVGDYQAWWYNALGQERDEYLYSQTDARRITLAETPLTMRRVSSEPSSPGDEDVTEEYWDDRVSVNLKHLFFCSQAVVPGMKGKGGGAIINLGSISWHLGLPDLVLYQTCKAGIEGLTRAMARDLGEDNIRVSCVVPGNVRTPRQLKWYTPEGEAEIVAAQCLKGRLEPPDIAAMVLFLASDDAKLVTGHEHFVDAGWR